MGRKVTAEEMLREAITCSGLTPYTLAKQVGLTEQCLWKFVTKGTGLRLRTAQRLFDFFNLEVQGRDK
jgi:hypothetical protein